MDHHSDANNTEAAMNREKLITCIMIAVLLAGWLPCLAAVGFLLWKLTWATGSLF